jgi:hypothetical protein
MSIWSRFGVSGEKRLDPRWRLLYDDKRYAALVEKMGLPKFPGKFSKQ